ncbi:MAG: hypothetical protein ACLQLH_04610 [Terracidiphilus sp.]
MAQVRKFSAFGLVSLLSIFSLTAIAQSGDLAAIQQKLNEQFKLTTTSADGSDIVAAGDVVTLHKSNLLMFAYANVPAANNYSLYQPKHSNGPMVGGIGQGFETILISVNPNTVQRTFVPGEKFWVTGIRVQKDGALFMLCSDPYNGARYYGNLKIHFPVKKAVPPVDSFLQMVADVMTVDGQSDQQEPAPDQGDEALRKQRVQRYLSQGQPAPVSEAAPAPAPAPLPAIAPPPPPADTPPPVISLGQTEAQVTSAFGQPMRIAKLGAKEIFYYKDMKVTFTEGSVSNVE